MVISLRVVPIDEEQMFFYAFAAGGTVVTFTLVLTLHSMFTSSSGVSPQSNQSYQQARTETSPNEPERPP